MSATATTASPRTHRLFSEEAVGGAPWLVLSKLVLFFVYLAISILTVRGLGKEAYGAFSVGRSIIEYLMVPAAFGLNAALLRFLPELAHHRNKAGIRRLLVRAAVVQVTASVFLGIALAAGAHHLGQWFGPAVAAILPWCALLLPALLAKDFFNDSMTALFLSKRVAMLSLVQGVLWLVLTAIALWMAFSVPGVLVAQAVSIYLVSAVAAVMLVRHWKNLDWRSPAEGIGRRRVARTALPVMFNGMARALMLKYTEVFFLGAFVGTAAAGVYDLGFTVPHLVITFIPLAVQTLLAASFHQTLARDPSAMPGLIDLTYKLLISLSVPLAAFGVFFSPRGVELVYGAEMRAAGPVAAAFCVLHLLPLISMPLSMAIAAREKVHRTLHLMILQVVINLILDIILIPRYGIPGAVAAVALTFLITIPLRLANVRSIIGGIHFPAGFLVRLAVPCALVSALMWWLAPSPTLPGLLGLSMLYLALLPVLVRHARLISPSDLRQLGSLLPARAAGPYHRIFGIKPDGL